MERGRYDMGGMRPHKERRKGRKSQAAKVRRIQKKRKTSESAGAPSTRG